MYTNYVSLRHLDTHFKNGDNITSLLKKGIELALFNDKNLYIPAGNFMIDDSIIIKLDKDFAIKSDATLIASDFPNKKFIQIISESYNKFSWIGGTLDVRGVPFSQPGEANDALNVLGIFKKVTLENLEIKMKGGSDSGIFAVTDNIIIRDVNIDGASDSAIYLSGNVPNGGESNALIDSCLFTNSISGITYKRGYKNIKVTNSTFKNIGVGVTAAAADGIVEGSEDIIIGNQFENCGRGIEARKTTGSIITGNRIINGTSWGILLTAATGAIVSNNVIINCPKGIELFSRDGIDCINNSFTGNFIKDCQVAILERDLNQNGNLYLNNFLDNRLDYNIKGNSSKIIN